MEDRKKAKRIKKEIKLSSIALIFFLIIIFLLCILNVVNKNVFNRMFCATGLKIKSEVTSDFSVHFIDVGQGDCSLIKCGDKNILIDTGDSIYSRKVIKYLKSQNVRKIDYLIISHPHSDHIGGLEKIAKDISVDTIFIINIEKSIEPKDIDYYNINKIISQKNFNIRNPVSEEKLKVKDAELIFYVPSYDSENLNNSSIVTMITYKDKKFLFTGDIEKASEKEFISKKYDLKADVLKVAHHGSNSSSTDEFLKAVNPEYCVISCGNDNSFTHPSDSTIKRLSVYSKDIFRTDLLSDIVFESDNSCLKYKFGKE